MKKSFFVLTLLIGCSAFIISSCSKSDPAPATTTTASPVAGTWTRSNGSVVFSLALNSDYSYALTSSGTSFESGSYTIAAPAITFNSSTGISGCSGKPGKYNYDISTIGSSTILTFTKVTDSCSNRSAAAVGPWNKQ